MDEIDVQQKARAFVASVDASNTREDLSAYVVKANAKVLMEELDKGESGYTITKPSGKHVLTINSLEPIARQRPARNRSGRDPLEKILIVALQQPIFGVSAIRVRECLPVLSGFRPRSGAGGFKVIHVVQSFI